MANSPTRPNILGKRIQTLRKKVNFSQKQLVARIENYDRSLRDFEVAAIAKALRVPVGEL